MQKTNWQLLKDGQKSWSTFHTKTKIMRFIREFFYSRNFVELDTPILAPSFPEEPNIYLTPATWLHKNKTFYHSPSPETFAKKALAAGVGNCFMIAKCIRDMEDIGSRHNLEFNMLEFYQVESDYQDVAKTVKELFLFFAKNFDSKIDFSSWHSFTVKELFSKHAGLNLDEILTSKSMIRACQDLGYNMDGVTTWEPGFHQIWNNLIEPQLPLSPTFVFDYPIQISTLCKPCQDPNYGQRFEFFINQMEFGNCYTELTVPEQQLKNFKTTKAEKESIGKPTHPIDMDLIEALKFLPSCSGVAIGVERLAMLFAGTNDINDVVLFPTKEMI